MDDSGSEAHVRVCKEAMTEGDDFQFQRRVRERKTEREPVVRGLTALLVFVRKEKGFLVIWGYSVHVEVWRGFPSLVFWIIADS